MNHPNYRSLAGMEEIQSIYDAVIAGWPAPNERHAIDTRHGRTFAITSGDKSGPALILLHGSASSSFGWMNDAARYGRFFHTIAVDIPGEAGKSDPRRFSWQDDSAGEWLADIYSHFDLRQASLAGLSLGGYFAARFAAGRPAAVSRLALISAGGICRERASFIPKAILWKCMGARGEERMEHALFRRPLPPEVSHLFRLMAREFIPRMEKLRLLSDEEIRRLAMPILFLGGSHDILVDTAVSAARLRRLLPHAKTILVPEAGHALTDTAPLILEFLMA
jgi:Predicted hydrolases or acyltransferases (alpha/beta hydrolase superfamily)